MKRKEKMEPPGYPEPKSVLIGFSLSRLSIKDQLANS
jgi:hypothetical protein